VNARLTVRVTTRASRNEIAGVRPDGLIVVRVSAPPADGKANAAVIGVVAAALGIAPSRLRIVAGGSSRTKTLEVSGIVREDVSALLEQASHP
jgi:uncharacterized protein (TIGR00251 family)